MILRVCELLAGVTLGLLTSWWLQLIQSGVMVFILCFLFASIWKLLVTNNITRDQHRDLQ